MKVVSIGAIIIGLLGSTIPAKAQDTSESTKKKYLMAAMGDSITAGFLAGTFLTWFNTSSRQYQNEINTFMTALEQNNGRNPQSFNFSGNLAHIFETRNSFSWSTGKLIPSQYVLLKAKILKTEPSAKLSAYNIAVSGGFTSDLVNEAKSLVAKMKTGKFDALKYVTILIGNNDVCHYASAEQMNANIHETFRLLSLIQQNEPIRVLVSGIPRIPDTAAPQIRSNRTIFGLTCHELRKLTNSCPAMSDWTTQEQYDALIQQIQGTNELLSAAVDVANKSFSNLNAIFSNRLFELDIASTDLALDCFHPNANTQSRLSQELWNDQHWFQ